MRVDSARDAVFHFQVKLGDLVNIIDTVLLHISLSGSFDHVTHLKALDGFVLRNAAGAVRATHRLHGPTSLSVLSSVTV